MSFFRAFAPAVVIAALASVAASPSDHKPIVDASSTKVPAAHPMDATKIAAIESTFKVEVGESTLVVIGDAHVR